jgi:hypothetical protein
MRIHRSIYLPLILLVAATMALAQTPRLNIKTRHGFPMEEQRKQQMERLAKQYDLKKYTLTRDLIIERGAVNHSSPVLTLNLRFLDDDDLALSAYVHEQAHWVLMERHKSDFRDLMWELEKAFPNMETSVPEGAGDKQATYVHLVVNLLEWQAMEDLVGPERARRTTEWKEKDHYKGIYRTVLADRDRVQMIMNRFGIKW